MSRELMVVEPDLQEYGRLDAPAVLRSVYRCYGFQLQDEIPSAGKTFIVATQTGESEPQPVSRDDYFADSLDPVRGKASSGRKKRMSLRGFTLRGNMLVFLFQPES